MVQKLKVEGFEAFQAKIAEITASSPGKDLYVLFSGSKNDKGKSSHFFNNIISIRFTIISKCRRELVSGLCHRRAGREWRDG